MADEAETKKTGKEPASLFAAAAKKTGRHAPASSSSPAADAFASVKEDRDNPTMVEWTKDGRPVRWVVDATGVETAWSAWRATRPDGAPEEFMDRLRERVPAIRVRSLGLLRL